jgi:hypothetical protein
MANGDEAKSATPSTSTQARMEGIAIKMPPFWRKNVRVWFLQVETQFARAKITREETKYSHVVESLDPEIIDQMFDYFAKPVPENAYSELKKKILREFEDSATRKSKKLLECELGDAKPTALLREMRSLAGDLVSEEFLRSVFLDRLPNSMRAMVASSDADLDKVAIMADRIAEVETPVYHIAATTKTAHESRLEAEIKN